MTLGIDLDLDYSNEIANRVLERPSGSLTPTHPIGPGIVAAPFVGAFSLVDRALGQPVIHDRTAFAGSWSIFGFFVASASALLAGAWFYLRSFELLQVRLSRPFVLLLLAGTGVAFYGLNRFTMGHSFEFAASALVLWASVALATEHPHPQVRGLRRGPILVALASGIVLSLLIRPANVNILLLPSIMWTSLRMHEGRGPGLVTRAAIRRLALVLVPSGVVLFALNRVLYGAFIPSRSQMYGSRPRGVLDQVMEVILALPSLRHVLFSSEYGIVYFMAIVPIGITLLAAVVFGGGRARSGRMLAVLSCGLSLIYVAVPVAVVLIWQSHARSYGYRYLFSLIPLGMLGVALWWRRPHPAASKTLRFSLAGLSGFGVLGQVFFQTAPALRPGPGVNAFGREAYSHAAVGYAPAVLEAIVSPMLWVSAGVMRVPGYVGGLILGPVRTASLAERLGFIPLTRTATGTEIDPLTAFEWFSRAAPGVLVTTALFTAVVLPAALILLLRGRRRSVGAP
jgi:hypothetical protein